MLSTPHKITLVVLDVYTDAIAIVILAFVAEALYRAAVFIEFLSGGLEFFILVSSLGIAALFIPFRIKKAIRLFRGLSHS